MNVGNSCNDLTKKCSGLIFTQAFSVNNVIKKFTSGTVFKDHEYFRISFYHLKIGRKIVNFSVKSPFRTFWTILEHLRPHRGLGPFGTILTNLDHYGTSETTESFWTILAIFGPFRTTLHNFGPFWTINDHLDLFRTFETTFETILDHLRCLVVLDQWDHLGHFDHLGPFRTIFDLLGLFKFLLNSNSYLEEFTNVLMA